ncbi:HAD family hydrolase [Candidatus Woesearchaeota archaeon]|nr:HAD family hydrolase [Candidatus Woesearchaeota archaeon]
MKAALLDIIGTLLEKKSRINFIGASEHLQKKGYNIYYQALEAAYRYVIFVKFTKVPIRSYEELCRLIFESMDERVDDKTLGEVAELMRKSHQLTLFDDVIPFLNKIKGKYSIALVTTTPKFMFEESLGASKKFYDKIITGWEAKASKPDPKIYLAALNSLNVSPQEVFFIGDEIDLDILPPKKLGMKTIFISRTGSKCNEADYSVKSLTECLEFMK